MEADLIVVRGFELLSVILFVGGLIWVSRQKNSFYLGAYLGSTFAGIYFDWINNLNWFLRVKFDERFITLYRMDGWPQPLAMSSTYAFYFGIPLLLLIHYEKALESRFGQRGQYPVVGFLGMIALPIFEIPMVQAFGLWTYYQKPEFLIGGVAWTNWFYSALAFMMAYAALIYVRRVVFGSAIPTERWKGIIFGFGTIVAAFALTQFIQMMIYAVTDPWIATPRPF